MKWVVVWMVAAWAAGAAYAEQHVQWSVADVPAAPPGGKVVARITGRIDPDWHLYSASSAAGIPTSFQLGPNAVVERTRIYQTRPKRAFDPNFNTDTETYQGEATFLLEMDLRRDAPPGSAELPLAARFETCNDKQCVPGRWSTMLAVKVDPAAAATLSIPSGFWEAEPPAANPAGSSGGNPREQGWGLFLLAAFGFGLASIFTPCVFPMIPITLSYFLSQQGGEAGNAPRRGLAQAAVFCLGIIVLFSGLGLAITAILGPVGVVQLGANPWVNGFIAALFTAFGLSLLGAFEITIPSAVLTRLHQSSEKGGFMGSLLMGLAFSLSAFACVGPFVGTLLAASVTGGGAKPLAGMVTFATGLALPFFLLALFPSYLKRLPRSGGWLARVKVVMGFVILAVGLKYLAAVDQTMGWDVLTRGRFLAAWIVLFAMAGLYLLGFVRLEGVKPDDRMGLGRLLTGMALLIFAISLWPGMTGAPLGGLDAYVPAAETPATGATSPGTGLVWIKDQYRAALDQARREGKLVFVNFTGVACANCHWMEANMFRRPEIADALRGFVLVELYTDRTDAVSEANEKLEESKFQTVAEPLYAILDADEHVIATFAGKTGDSAEFLAFLHKGAAAPPQAQAQASSGSGLGSFTSIDGAPVETAGKVVVMNFWATWCVPCLSEIPGFNRMQQDLAAKGVLVLGVAMDEDGAAVVKPFLKKHPISYTVALGSAATGKQFGVENEEGYPVTLIFDRTGREIKRFDGLTSEDALRAAVQQALQASPRA